MGHLMKWPGVEVLMKNRDGGIAWTMEMWRLALPAGSVTTSWRVLLASVARSTSTWSPTAPSSFPRRTMRSASMPPHRYSLVALSDSVVTSACTLLALWQYFQIS